MADAKPLKINILVDPASGRLTISGFEEALVTYRSRPTAIRMAELRMAPGSELIN